MYICILGYILWATQLNLFLWAMERRHVSSRNCQSWKEKEWSTSSKYLSIQAVEEAPCDRLRLKQYRHCFADDAAAKTLAVSWEENQTPVLVEPLLLRQWHQKYHPDSEPIKVDTAEYQEVFFRSGPTCRV